MSVDTIARDIIAKVGDGNEPTKEEVEWVANKIRLYGLCCMREQKRVDDRR